MPSIHLSRYRTPTAALLSVDEVRAFLRVRTQNENNLLLSLIKMTTEYAEWYMEKSLRKQQWLFSCIDYIPHKIYPPFGPVSGIDRIEAYYGFRVKVTIKSSDYLFNGRYIRFITYPSLVNFQKLDILYTAGYTKDSLPQQIKEGILHHIAAIYFNRYNLGSLSFIKNIYDMFREIKLVL